MPGQEQLRAAVTQLRTAGTAAGLPGVTPAGSCETPGLCETDSPSQSLSLHIGVVVKRRWPIIILMATIIPAACHLLSEGVN